MKHKRRDQFLYKMVWSYTVVFSLLLGIVLTIVYFVLASGESERAVLTRQLLVNQPLKQVEKFVGEMDDVAYKAMADQKLINVFSARREENDPGNYFTVNVMTDIETASLLKGINRGIAPVWRLAAYNDKGDYISTGTIVDKSMVEGVLQQRNPAQLMEMFRAEDAPDFILLPAGQDAWSDYYQSSYISLLRPIMNPYSRDVVGIVEVQQNIRVLEEYLDVSEQGAPLTNIYDQDGDPVLRQQRPEDEVVAEAVSDIYGWKVELLESPGVMRTTKVQLGQILVAAWLVLTLVMLVVINLIATRIAKPLTTLTREVRQIDIAQPKPIPLINTKVDEIVSLQTAFNQVIDSLSFSMDQEKKSFLLAMQAQMNPHFLYNVLSVINAVALEGKSETIVAICGNLSGMLRYSSSYAKGTATVAEELMHTREYLELMKARYDYMFQYEIYADPGLEDKVIPKLVIQPICENAFTHPFANMEPPYKLAIRVQKETEGWSIEVEDNGSGFAEEQRAEVMERSNQAQYQDLSNMQIGGLGLISSVLRLKLITKQQVRCEILSARPQGAIVKIIVLEQPTITE